MADINIENLNKDRIKLVDEIKQKQEQTMTDCVSLPNVSLIDRHILENLNEEDTAFRHVISEYGWKVWFDKRFITDYISHLKFTIEALVQENEKLKADRDAAVADLKSIAPCQKCKHFGVNQMTCDALEKCLYGEEQAWEWRGVQKEEEDATD